MCSLNNDCHAKRLENAAEACGDFRSHFFLDLELLGEDIYKSGKL